MGWRENMDAQQEQNGMEDLHEIQKAEFDRLNPKGRANKPLSSAQAADPASPPQQ